MDPDANLAEQLALAAKLSDDANFGRTIDLREAERLSDLVIALNTWIVKGGALPAAWGPGRCGRWTGQRRKS